MAAHLPDDPALMKALIAALQAENAQISATLRAHDHLIQTLRARISTEEQADPRVGTHFDTMI